MKKKGVEMSLNVIIIAAIGLLILVILAFLVINGLNKVPATEKTSCNLRGGVCQQAACGTNQQITGTNTCVAPTPNCCKIIP
jgi:hypothetical protein